MEEIAVFLLTYNVEKMSRTNKIYERLDQLETEFRKRLTDEFQKGPSGAWSRYLSRKIPHLMDGRFWRNAEAAELEMMEKDIVALREKLGEPISESPVNILREFCKRRSELKDPHSGSEAALVKEMLSKLAEEEKLNKNNGAEGQA